MGTVAPSRRSGMCLEHLLGDLRPILIGYWISFSIRRYAYRRELDDGPKREQYYGS